MFVVARHSLLLCLDIYRYKEILCIHSNRQLPKGKEQLLTSDEIKKMIYKKSKKSRNKSSCGRQSSGGRSHAANICNDFGRARKKQTIRPTNKVRIVLNHLNMRLQIVIIESVFIVACVGEHNI